MLFASCRGALEGDEALKAKSREIAGLKEQMSTREREIGNILRGILKFNSSTASSSPAHPLFLQSIQIEIGFSSPFQHCLYPTITFYRFFDLGLDMEEQVSRKAAEIEEITITKGTLSPTVSRPPLLKNRFTFSSQSVWCIVLPFSSFCTLLIMLLFMQIARRPARERKPGRSLKTRKVRLNLSIFAKGNRWREQWWQAWRA